MSLFDKVNVYTTNHPLNEIVSKSLVKGFDARKIPAVSIVDGIGIVYGILRGGSAVIDQSIQAKQDYVYCDHSFFGVTRSTFAKTNGYFRLCINDRYTNYQIDDLPGDRLRTLNLNVKPWRTTGKHIVVVPMSNYIAELNGISAKGWLGGIVQTISRFTDRDIVIKPKDGTSLTNVLDNAWAVVAADSNAAVDAVVAGIPVFCSSSNAAYDMSGIDLGQIETPRTPDRTIWLRNLAYWQFTLEEIENGIAKDILQDIYNETPK